MKTTAGGSFNRPPRIRPRWTAEEVQLPEPPVAPARREGVAWLSLLMPMLGAFLLGGASLMSGGGWLMAAPSLILGVLGVGAALQSERAATRRAAAEYAGRRALFEDQLDAQRGRLRRLHEQERTARLYLAPDPADLLSIAGAGASEQQPTPRLWERRQGDDDFLELRAGCGALAAATVAYVPPPPRDGPVDRRLYRIAAEYATLSQTPICLPLATLGSLGLAGPRAAALPLAHALLWQAAVLHAPGDLRIAAVAHSTGWEWLRWLPHSVPPSNDPAHDRRMVACDSEAAALLLASLLDELSRRRERRARATESAPPPHEPQILLLVDGAEPARAHPALHEILRHGAPLGLLVVVLVPAWPLVPEPCAAMLDVSERGARWTRAGQPWPRERFSPDRADMAASDRLARRLAGVRLAEGGSQDLPRSVRLFDLLGLADEASLARPRLWDEPLAGAWRGDVPIGVLAEGKPLYLDLGEGRHGPHGIIAGATGAGKSVLLQSIIAALAAAHPPERMQLLLIDFKGGAALAMFEPLPHTAGLVTDLEGRMAERAIIAIKSELRRRKALLKATADNLRAKVENIRDYRALADEQRLAPLPNLLIVVDEFDELARSYPEFVGELVRVVKQGRSLGVHLLLATQQPARAVTDEIRSQLTFFIALRVGGGDASREMILKPDAAFLPADTPGRAYFRVGGEARLFQVALVTGEHRPPAAAGPRVSFVGTERTASSERPAVSGPRRSDLDLLLPALCAAGEARLEALGWRPAPIWRAPLPARLNLGDLPAPAGTWLRAAPALLDVPHESRQEPLALNLAAAHLAVVGAPGSGKTTMLRSLALDLAGRHSPRDLWLYLIDAGGQGLSALIGLPHTGALIQARERERVRRLIRMLDAAIRERQDRFRAAGAADLPAYNAAAPEPLPALLLLIDKIAVLREELRDAHGDGLVEDLIRLARIGRPFGVHLVISADRATDLTHKLMALIEGRLALRMPELHDYNDLLGTRVASQLPAERPGRGLWAHPDLGTLEFQTALPGLEPLAGGDAREAGAALESDLIADLRESVATVARRWSHVAAAPWRVELLPERVLLGALPGSSLLKQGLRATVGRESMNLGAASLELNGENPHALILGGRRSGKTTALLTIARSLAGAVSPDELRLLLLDSPRGGLAPLAELLHTAIYAQDEAGAAEIARLLAGDGRGARRLLLIDDYLICRDRMKGQLTTSYGGESNLLDLLNEAAQVGGQRGVHMLIAASISYPDDNLLRALDAARCGMILWPGRYEGGTRLLGLGLPPPDLCDADQPPGRALLIHDDEQQLIQVAL